jgi:hypothetical protein
MKVLGRNYEMWDNNQMDLKIISFNLNENEREMVSTAAFGVCATCRILRISRTFEHTFLKGLSVPSARWDWLPARSTSTSSELSLGRRGPSVLVL